MNLEDARDLLDQGAVLLDVRTRAEYEALHVPGAIHVPTGAGPEGSLAGLADFLEELLALVDYDRTRPILVYCKRGTRAQRAKAMLLRAGFSNVANLGGVEVEPMRSLIARGEALWRRPPPDLRPILYQFFRDFPFVESGGAEWNPLAWSMGLETGAQAEQLAYEALGATLDVPGLGPFQPYRQRALYDFTRGQIQAQTGGTAFQPWQGFQEGAPQGFSAGAVRAAKVARAVKAARRRGPPRLAGGPFPKHPAGKGIFVRSVPGAGGAQRIAQMAQWAGLEWVAVQVWWKDEAVNHNEDDLSGLSAALGAAGVRLWYWGWPLPGQRQAFAQAVSVAGSGRNWSGLILDVEGSEWFGQGAEAKALLSACRAVLGGRGLGVTSYGYEPNFPEIPWAQLAAADFGMPQVYKGSIAYGPSYEAEAIARWQELGFPAIVPALAAYYWTAAQMLEIYRRTPLPDGAVVWWDLFNADQEPARWEAIRAAGSAYTVGGRTAEWRGRDTPYERPPRPFPPGPWVIPPSPAPRFAPGHPWWEFAVQRFRSEQDPYGQRRGATFTRSAPLPGAGYSAGQRRLRLGLRARPVESRFHAPWPPAQWW